VDGDARLLSPEELNEIHREFVALGGYDASTPTGHASMAPRPLSGWAQRGAGVSRIEKSATSPLQKAEAWLGRTDVRGKA